jgi:eukaryotic-like serine/threonine-protein kinase
MVSTGMSERAAASALEEGSPISGDQPTLAATPEQQAAAASGQRRGRGDAWSGREIAGRYLIHEQLGEGGMGLVYIAEHLHLKKRVAFKIIHPELAAREELLVRFKREALATGQLDHPHIAAAIDFGELESGGAFMVMPLVRGRSLQAEVDDVGALEVRRVARLGSQIADALSAAHAVGIVHRDLKPDNVLIERRSDGSESAKVLDFGVASLAGQPGGLSVDARPLTQAGTILGTPGYMSPEQATAGEVDHRTDLYALGVILWELCRGERLFDGDDITQIFAKQFKSLPPALELGVQASARELSQLVGKLLAWDKSARPNSASQVRDALRRIAELPDTSLANITAPGLTLLRELRAKPVVTKLWPYRLPISLVLAGAMVFALFGGEEAKAPAHPEPVASAPAPSSEPEKRSEKSKVRAAVPAPIAEDRDEDPDEAVERAGEQLMTSRARESRRAAAKVVVRHHDEAPRYLQLVADLELADRCQEKKQVVADMQASGDKRVLPALERLAEAPRRGCGLLKLSDCHACLRRDLAAAISELQD